MYKGSLFNKITDSDIFTIEKGTFTNKKLTKIAKNQAKREFFFLKRFVGIIGLFKTFHYLPMQKSLKILPNISSTSTLPTIIPRWRVANLKSSAALSKSSVSFFSLNFSR